MPLIFIKTTHTKEKTILKTYKILYKFVNPK